LLKTKYEYLIEDYSIGNTDKKELYKFSPILLHEFNNYLNKDNSQNDIIEYNNLEMILNQNSLYMDKNKYEYLIIKENNNHALVMKDKELELTKLKYANIDKEIELIKAQTEYETIKTKNINHKKSLSKSNKIIKI
jgi:hypothetical protein